MADFSDSYPTHAMTEGWKYYNDNQARRQASGQSSHVIMLRMAEMSLRTTITEYGRVELWRGGLDMAYPFRPFRLAVPL